MEAGEIVFPDREWGRLGVRGEAEGLD